VSSSLTSYRFREISVEIDQRAPQKEANKRATKGGPKREKIQPPLLAYLKNRQSKSTPTRRGWDAQMERVGATKTEEKDNTYQPHLRNTSTAMRIE